MDDKKFLASCDQLKIFLILAKKLLQVIECVTEKGKVENTGEAK